MATPAAPTWLRVFVLLGGGLLPVRVATPASAATAAAWPAPGPGDAAASVVGPAGPRLSIASDTTCPSGQAVADALAALCPPAEWPNGSVRIQAMADVLVVDLISDESTRRQLKVATDCGVRASTVALVIATWTGELSSDAAGAPVLRDQPADVRNEASLKKPGLPGIAVATTERQLGGGLLLAVSGGVVPGVRIDFVQTRAPRGLGWQAGLTLPAGRDSDAAGGTTIWTRAAASVAVNGRISVGRFALSADAGLAGAYTFTSGRGYTVEQGAQSLTGGLVAGARLALPWRHMCIWTDVRAYKWLFPQTVAVDSTDGERVATAALPSSDFQWAVGIAYMFR